MWQAMKTAQKKLSPRPGAKERTARQPATIAAKLATLSDREINRLLRRSSRSLLRRRPAGRRTRAPNWTEAEDRLLGTWPDERLARFLDRTLKAVQTRRLKQGIRFGSPPPRWTADEKRLLDPALARGPIRKWTGEVARRLGRSVVAIRRQRRLKYGPVFPSPRKWSVRELRLLGTRRDREVATLIGRKCVDVQVKRCALGIPSFRARHKFKWTPAADRLLGTQPDRVLAERLGCSHAVLKARRRALGISSVGRRLWTPEEERLVGTMRDEEVARRLGRSRKSVVHRRRALNLSQPKAETRVRPPRP